MVKLFDTDGYLCLILRFCVLPFYSLFGGKTDVAEQTNTLSEDAPVLSIESHE